MTQNKPPAPQHWVVWTLDNHDEHGNEIEGPSHVIITTADGKTEITGIVHDPKNAPLLAAAPDLLHAARLVVERWASGDFRQRR